MSLLSWLPNRNRPRSRSSRPRFAQPRLEFFERRDTPSTFTVNTLNDTALATLGDPNARDANGNTSLRSAVQEANFEATRGTRDATIRFASTLGGTIDLLIPLDNLQANIDIQGPGANVLTVARPSTARTDYDIFTVASRTSCEIQDLTITGGKSENNGGGIDNQGALTVAGCNITNNQAANNGGGIENEEDATLQIVACQIYDNEAGRGGGGVDNQRNGTVTICCGTVIDYNTANYGGGVNNWDGSLTVQDTSEINWNTALAGGGVYSNGDLRLARVEFDGGAIYSNTAETDAATSYGGGIYIGSGTATATFNDTDIEFNDADKGGAVYANGGTVSFTNCTITNNTATTLGPGICYNPAITPTVTGGECQSLTPDR